MAVTYDREKDILYVDNSILSTYVTCPLKAAISYGLDRRLTGSDVAHLKAGSAIHTALEYYFGWPLDSDTPLQALEDEYKDWALENVSPKDRMNWHNVKLVLESWLARNPREELAFTINPEHIEIPFEVPLNEDGSIIFTGRIDLIGYGQAGNSCFVIDNKTTGWVDSSKKKEYSINSQMSGYLWATKQLGWNPAGIYINLVHTGIVPNSNSKCTKHAVTYEECGFEHMKHEWLGPYHRSPQELESWRTDALSWALEWRQVLRHLGDDVSRLKDIQQRGKWTYKTCTYCDWYDYCKGGQKDHWITNFTVIDPWRPGVLGE